MEYKQMVRNMTEVMVLSEYGGGYSVRLPVADDKQLENVKRVLEPLNYTFRRPNR
jgi:hypothetical protein